MAVQPEHVRAVLQNDELTPWRRRNALYTAIRLVSVKINDDILKDDDDIDEETTVARFHELGDLVQLYFEAREADEEQRQGRSVS